jgi:hypothetical protein
MTVYLLSSVFQNGIYCHFTKKSPLGRGNAKGARRGDKNCADLVITQIENDARGIAKIFIFFLQEKKFTTERGYRISATGLVDECL